MRERIVNREEVDREKMEMSSAGERARVAQKGRRESERRRRLKRGIEVGRGEKARWEEVGGV